ncbi:atrial natriuretic peptide receptor 3-like [Gigantopelta aegis]|uniref:atrial natriuretic peptide receptor 3-like n=1 Tax=Gigantopelta aegis TaxID=1735272 RepID=UPI001B889B1D|nr:atrial natriuretic peptide receptor 3-like [Gigantopelta aegis]
MVTAAAMARDFGRVKKSMFQLLTRVGPIFNSLVEMLILIFKHFKWNRVKLIYDPEANEHIVDRYCHILTDGIHHGLRTERRKNLTHEYYKFHKMADILSGLEHEIGREFAASFDLKLLLNIVAIKLYTQKGDLEVQLSPKQEVPVLREVGAYGEMRTGPAVSDGIR